MIDDLLQQALQHHQASRFDRALSLYAQILARDPNHLHALHYTGVALHQQRRSAEALPFLHRSVALAPAHPGFLNNLGEALRASGDLPAAVDAYQRALALNPQYAEAHANLGLACQSLHQFDRAADCWERALSLNPSNLPTLLRLAALRSRQGFPGLSIPLLQRALSLNPALLPAHNSLGNALAEQGRLDEALAAYRTGLQHHPAAHALHSNLLYILTHSDLSPDKLVAEHRAWAEQHALSALPKSSTPRATSSPLRIAYTSPDFRDGQIALFLEPILSHHDRKNFHITCYSDVAAPDAVTERLQSCVDAWENTLSLTDEQFAQRVRDDRIDILIDLTVHAGLHRLRAFSRQPAPIQMTYLGYPYTTGLTSIDYRLTDPHLDPPGLTESIHSEKLLRLPQTYFCYQPPACAPDVGPLPFDSAGHITFGSFNRLIKLTNPVLDLWSTLLTQLPSAKLLVKSPALSDSATRDLLLSRFAKHDISSSRLELHGPTPLPDYLSLMNRIDLALDPWPFSGGTTTCHLLWMGVPVVTLAGTTPLSRIGLSILTNTHLTDLIATTPQDYLHRAATLAQNPARLADLRATMRDRLRASPLLNAPRFTRHLESAYRIAWQRHTDHLPPEHLTIPPLPAP
ncbi:MAG TPA: tetratricopeptide repeat protein [Tepidisphaeraceae bacterium]|jgi:predicted O-linked N-acetylglucosamine transferase (SPINDLY family)|nr:tetratricopeptide repeat protein [Tepidisphaeraceae bacterium]